MKPCAQVKPMRKWIDTYTHDGRVGVMIELACETTVPLRSTDFAALAHDLAMQVASEKPGDVAELLHQHWIKDPARSVRDLLDDAEGKFSEKIRVTRFVRWNIDDPVPPESGPAPKSPASLMRLVK